MGEQIGVYKGRRSDEWSTPRDLFQSLDQQYDFTFDVAASKDNARIDQYWTKEDNALTKDWDNSHRYWMNPPFSKAKEFFEKIKTENGKNKIKLVSIYKASNLETKTWQEYILETANWVLFLDKRVNFDSHAGSSNQVPFGSALIGYNLEPPINAKGKLWILKQ